VARKASINLISADEASQSRSKSSKDRIFVFDVQERKLGKELREDESVLANCSSHQREYHRQENTISVSIWIPQRRFHTASYIV